MDKDSIVELLEQLGYTGARQEIMLSYLGEWARRKDLLKAGPLSLLDIVNASFIFDALNKRQKGK